MGSDRRPPARSARDRLSCLLSLRSGSSGSTSVEFALIAPFLFLTILFVISIGYMIFMNQALAYATQKAARAIRTGQVQAAGITSSSSFAAADICPYLPSLFKCSNVIVFTSDWPTNVWIRFQYPYTIYTPFINSTNTGLIVPTLSTNNTFCPGSGSQYVFLEVLYPVPFFLSFLSSSSVATTYNGQKYYMITSTAVFLNEPFTATSVC